MPQLALYVLSKLMLIKLFGLDKFTQASLSQMWYKTILLSHWVLLYLLSHLVTAQLHTELICLLYWDHILDCCVKWADGLLKWVSCNNLNGNVICYLLILSMNWECIHMPLFYYLFFILCFIISYQFDLYSFTHIPFIYITSISVPST